MMNQRVAVIGGGISGLAAANQLLSVAPETEIHLIEAGTRLGGVIKTTKKEGFLIEGAADNFITTSPTAIQLCKDLGLGDDLIQTNPKERGAMVVSRGKLERIPDGFVVMAPSRLWPLLSTKILSPMGKLRSGCELFIPRKRNRDDESLKSFVCRRFGSEMFERLVQPLVGGIYTADPNRLSVGATMPRFLEMERQHGSLIRGMLKQRRSKSASSDKNSSGARYSQFMTLRGGMSRLIDALAQRLPQENIHTETPVQCVVPDGSRWLVICGGDQPSVQRFDAVIVATPANHSARILSQVDSTLSRQLEQIEYASCAVVSMAFKKDQIRHPLNSFGFVVPQIENHLILSCSFSSIKYDGRAPDGTVLMRVFIGGACQSGLLRMPDVHLRELAYWELNKLLGIKGEPILSHVTRQNQAMPQYHVGHKERVATIKESLEHHPSLALAGSALSGVGVPGCIESGKKAADRIAEALANIDTFITERDCQTNPSFNH